MIPFIKNLFKPKLRWNSNIDMQGYTRWDCIDGLTWAKIELIQDGYRLTMCDPHFSKGSMFPNLKDAKKEGMRKLKAKEL